MRTAAKGACAPTASLLQTLAQGDHPGWVLSKTEEKGRSEPPGCTGLSDGTPVPAWDTDPTYFFIIIIFLLPLLAACTAPGRRSHQAKAPLSWRLYLLLRTGGTAATGG